MRIVRNLIIGLIILALLMAGAVYFTLNNYKARNFAARRALSYYFKSMPIDDLTIGGFIYHSAASWELQKVFVKVLLNGKMASVKVAEVHVKDGLSFAWNGQGLWLSVIGVEASFDKLRLMLAAGKATINRSAEGLSYRGDVSADEVVWDKLKASGIRLVFSGDGRSLVLQNVMAKVCEGGLRASMQLIFPDRYSIDAILEAASIAKLERAFGGAFHELGGQLSGHAQVDGAGELIERLNASIEMPAGGQISASLLSSISGYLPKSVQKKRLDALVLSGGKLAVEIFSFTIVNDKPDHLSGKIGLKSREANLEINIAHEVNVDSRLDALLKAWRVIFK